MLAMPANITSNGSGEKSSKIRTNQRIPTSRICHTQGRVRYESEHIGGGMHQGVLLETKDEAGTDTPLSRKRGVVGQGAYRSQSQLLHSSVQASSRVEII